ncbi:MAG: cholesterol esterase [Nonomuraea sp.]|nr:cholesterol esterase [Nonomuraea sp.]
MAEQGRVRWKRFLLMVVPVAATTSALIGATAQGVIGATFVVSGASFKLYTGELRGQGFTLAPNVVRDKKGRVIPVIATGIRRGVTTDLCQSVLMESPFGTVTLRITGGRGGNEVTMENMVLDVAEWQSGATFRGLELGRDASTLTEVPGGRGPAGGFGGQGRSLTLRDVRLTGWAVTAATFNLPDFSIDVVRGDHECF